jgi:WD40 repeat protein
VWQWPGGKPLACLEGVADHHGGFAYALSGRVIVAPARDGTLLVFDLATGRKLRRIPTGGRHAFGRPMVLPDGRTLAVWQGNRWVKWDVVTGRPAGTLPASAWQFTLSANGKVMATVLGEGFLSLRNAGTGKDLVPLPRHLGLAYTRPLACAPDGKVLATAGRDQTLRLWDRGTGRPLRTIGVPGQHPSWVSFSPDSRQVAASLTPSEARPGTLRGQVRVWEASTGRTIFETPADGWSGATAVAPVLGPGGLLAVGRNPVGKGQSEVVVYDTRAGTSRSFPSASRIVALALAGGRLACATHESVEIVELQTNRQRRRIDLQKTRPDEEERTSALCFSPDGKRLAVGLGNRGTLLVDCSPGGAVRTLAAPEKVAVEALIFRGPDRLLAAGQKPIPTRSGQASDVHVWEALTGQVVRPAWRTEEALGLVFAPDGSELAVVRSGAVVDLWPAGG